MPTLAEAVKIQSTQACGRTRIVEGLADLTSITATEPTSSVGCEECIPIGGRWLHLRMCTSCGHVGCCNVGCCNVGCCNDSSNRHAAAHFDRTGHPVIQSFESGEHWAWCFVDEQAVPDVGVDLDRFHL